MSGGRSAGTTTFTERASVPSSHLRAAQSSPDEKAAGGSDDRKGRFYGDSSATAKRTANLPVFDAGDAMANPGLANASWMINVAKTGLIGLVIGSLIGAAKYEGSKRGVLFELDPQPEAFDLDPTLGVLFNRLAKHRHLQESAYEMALRYADAILLREREIARTRRATDGEHGLAQTFYLGVVTELLAMRNRASDGETRANIEILKDEITTCLRQHLLLIRHM